MGNLTIMQIEDLEKSLSIILEEDIIRRIYDYLMTEPFLDTLFKYKMMNKMSERIEEISDYLDENYEGINLEEVNIAGSKLEGMSQINIEFAKDISKYDTKLTKQQRKVLSNLVKYSEDGKFKAIDIKNKLYTCEEDYYNEYIKMKDEVIRYYMTRNLRKYSLMADIILSGEGRDRFNIEKMLEDLKFWKNNVKHLIDRDRLDIEFPKLYNSLLADRDTVLSKIELDIDQPILKNTLKEVKELEVYNKISKYGLVILEIVAVLLIFNISPIFNKNDNISDIVKTVIIGTLIFTIIVYQVHDITIRITKEKERM